MPLGGGFLQQEDSIETITGNGGLDRLGATVFSTKRCDAVVTLRKLRAPFQAHDRSHLGIAHLSAATPSKPLDGSLLDRGHDRFPPRSSLSEPMDYFVTAGCRQDIRYNGNTARFARRSDKALGARVSVARIAPSLLDRGRESSHGGIVAVHVEEKVFDEYYNGCCNGTFWPLFHSMPDRAVFKSETWKPRRVKRVGYGAMAECKDRGNGRSPKKPADQWHRQARVPHAEVRGSDPSGIELVLPRREVSSLTTTPPQPPFVMSICNSRPSSALSCGTGKVRVTLSSVGEEPVNEGKAGASMPHRCRRAPACE
ncbi:hypothetical protein PR048_007128 [Dryococelus australis]|uniref:Uncharacterized protein n=1 Tax=Dryococelus australis TaxID=614101 RepID=A0ABQ9IE06_9NEOP|nr:hypothetical protein PR048_007128 [Dryococelus australis]